ncbi:MAG: response regulator transcription factor [Oscillospiraceae bacterium]|jgi:DNA-binding response OmpR family regulator|nr:response regulator transcription factor [Oscillospiraceae bacterium]
MEKNTEILIVDDDPDIRAILRLMLEGSDYSVREASRGSEALERIDNSVKLIILDVMMPGEDGTDVCREIRRRGICVPVLFLTAKSRETDKVVGLRAGGDDYLTKPFSSAELEARVDALLRRYQVYQGADGTEHRSTRQGITIDFTACEVTREGQRIPLTDLEYKLFAYLMAHVGENVNARQLYEAVWQETYLLGSASTVMVHIRNLRRKLGEHGQESAIIKTAWGKGYRVD